ncbi:hypothetical protein EC968_009936, partial [Mortierella alpina]
RVMPAASSTDDVMPTGQVGNEPTEDAAASSNDMDVDVDLDHNEEAGMEHLLRSGAGSSSTGAPPATVAAPTGEDQRRLQNLHEERALLRNNLATVVRRLADKQATLEEATAAKDAVTRKDLEIQLMKEVLQSEPPAGHSEGNEKEETDLKEEPERYLKFPTTGVPKFQDGDNAREFLAELQSTLTAYAGEQRFNKDAQRYLYYYTQGYNHRRRLQDELRKRKHESLTWEDLESIFIRITMPPTNRIDEIRKIVDTGREFNETYRQFAMRVQRDVLLLGIEDSNSVILDALKHQ